MPQKTPQGVNPFHLIAHEFSSSPMINYNKTKAVKGCSWEIEKETFCCSFLLFSFFFLRFYGTDVVVTADIFFPISSIQTSVLLLEGEEDE